MTINNMPTTVRAWIVAREVNEELWFWGSWDDREVAENVAWQVGGVALARESVEG